MSTAARRAARVPGVCSSCVARASKPGRRTCEVCTARNRAQVPKRKTRQLTVNATTHARLRMLAECSGATLLEAIEMVLA